jgi:ribosomal protein S18 acetylase RimI-like enzyme
MSSSDSVVTSMRATSTSERSSTQADPTGNTSEPLSEPQVPLEILPLTSDRWHDFVDLFERKGPRGGSGPVSCWCMWWRQRSNRLDGGASRNRENMRQLVEAGPEPGLMAYTANRAIGWISVGPKQDYGQLARSRTYSGLDTDQEIWSIACFWIDPRYRHHGVARALVDASIDRAFASGAREIEAYPHRKGDHMGSVSLFSQAGFRPLREAGPRLIMRLGSRPASDHAAG